MTQKLLEKAAKAAAKTHKERVAEFNEKLENLSEHYDIPKVGRRGAFGQGEQRADGVFSCRSDPASPLLLYQRKPPVLSCCKQLQTIPSQPVR